MFGGLCDRHRHSIRSAACLALVMVVGVGLGGCASSQPANTATQSVVSQSATAAQATSAPTGAVTPSSTVAIGAVASAQRSAVATASAPAEQPATASASAAAASQCPAGTHLPAGIDPRVCGPVAGSVVTLDPSNMFVMPSGNIWCDIESFVDGTGTPDSVVRCFIAQASFPAAPDPNEANPGGDWIDDGMALGEGKAQEGFYAGDPGGAGITLMNHQPITTLQYGQATSDGTAVCISQSIGLSCWDITTTHGFFLSRTQALVW